MRVQRIDEYVDGIVIKITVSNAEMATRRYSPENHMAEIMEAVRAIFEAARSGVSLEIGK